MRKFASVSVGVGVFMIVAAILVRFYAYPTLATVPANYDGVTELESSGAQIFNSDPNVLKTETWDLDISAFTIADSGAKQPDDVATWVSSTTVTRADGTVFQQTRERAPFDAVSGAAVTCDACGSWEEVAEDERVDVTRKGQVFKFPFATEKRDYDVWDGTVNKATKATFEGEESIQGLNVYKFVQHIEPQVVETREVPGKVFGATEPSVDAEMWYGMTRTFYIEPQTGSPVDRVEERIQELRYDGVSVPAFTATVQYTDAQVTKSVKDTKSNATLLGGMRLTFPLLLLLLGAAFIAVGLFISRKSHRPLHTDANDKPLVGAGH